MTDNNVWEVPIPPSDEPGECVYCGDKTPFGSDCCDECYFAGAEN